ncbi:MAG: hypothetical protein IOMNBAOH_01325 [Rhodocyclaceae bacterium]|nr:hypothetical protein [Rhodocyclaceae bacterium]
MASCAEMPSTIEDLLHHPAVWRAGQFAHDVQGAQETVPTAHAALDEALPGGGWPLGALTESLVNEAGVGELSLFLPALRTVCAGGRGIALVAPPHLPHARAWEAAGMALDRLLIIDAEGAELLWSAEQILRSGACAAVLIWAGAAGRALDYRALQRLHLAASKGGALCVMYRGASAQTAPSPAPLRIRLAAQTGTLHVWILKCRGAPCVKPIPVQPLPAHWAAAAAPAAAAALAVSVPHAPAAPATAAMATACRSLRRPGRSGLA